MSILWNGCPKINDCCLWYDSNALTVLLIRCHWQTNAHASSHHSFILSSMQSTTTIEYQWIQYYSRTQLQVHKRTRTWLVSKPCRFGLKLRLVLSEILKPFLRNLWTRTDEATDYLVLVVTFGCGGAEALPFFSNWPKSTISTSVFI